MDIEVHPEDWKKEFGFGKAIALPTAKDSSGMKKSKSLHDTPELVEETSFKQKKGQSFSQKLKRFIGFKRRKTDGSVINSQQSSTASPSFVPNRTAFVVQTPTNPTSFASPESPVVNTSEPAPATKYGLDMDDIPDYVIRVLDTDNTGSTNSDTVRIAVLSEADVAPKTISLSKQKKLGFYLSMGLPPAVVTHMAPDSQAASLGIVAGDRIVSVSGVDCSAKTGREVRDLVHLGRVMHYSPSLGNRPKIEVFDQSGTKVTSPDTHMDSVDEETWQTMKKMEESIQSKGTSSKESNQQPTSGETTNVSTNTTPKSDKSSPRNKSRPKSMFDENGKRDSPRIPSQLQSSLRDSPQQHSTPIYAKDDLHCEKYQPDKHQAESLLLSDEGTSPIAELPRASLSTQADSLLDSFKPTKKLSSATSTSSDEGVPISHLPRASVSESLTENVASRDLPDLPEVDHTPHDQLSTPHRVDVTGLSQQVGSRTVTFNESPVSVRSNVSENSKKSRGSANRSPGRKKQNRESPLPGRKSVQGVLAVESSSSEQLRSKSTNEKQNRSPFFGDRHSKSPRQELKPSPQHFKKKETTYEVEGEEEDSDEIDEDDIVKSFEEVIASSPAVTPPGKVKLTSNAFDSSRRSPQIQTPQWVVDAATRRNTRLNEEDSLAHKLREKQSQLRKTSESTKKHLNFAELPLPSSHTGELKHSLSGELLAVDSNFYVKKPLSKYDRARSMEEGINLDDQSQPITIDPNVRRKKSGLMVGKHTGQNTFRPTILDYGQTGDEGSSGRRVSEEAITNVIHIHHSRSFSDEIVTSAVKTDESTVPSVPHLLGTTEGRSKLKLSKHRGKRKLSNKNALFLHTGDQERYAEVRVDPSSPQAANNTDKKEKITKPVKPVKANIKVPSTENKGQEGTKNSILKWKKNSPEQKDGQEDRFKNMVIGASWGTGVQGGPITRRSTYTARTSTSTTAALVAQAAAKKSRELRQTIPDEREGDTASQGIRRDRRFKSMTARPVPPKDSSKKSSVGSTAVGDKTSMNERTKTVLSTGTGGVQTFQIPLHKVPRSERVWGNGNNPPWKSSVKAKSEGTVKSEEDTTSKGVAAHSELDSTIPKAGHVKDKLRLFSMLK